MKTWKEHEPWGWREHFPRDASGLCGYVRTAGEAKDTEDLNKQP